MIDVAPVDRCLGKSDAPSGEPAPRPVALSRVKRWLREPLLHFLLIGLMLFAMYHVLNPDLGDRDQTDRIELTEDDLHQLVVAWTAQWRRPPTPKELRGLLENKIREEVLYREALALGLDQGDTIVKRRMAQKMEFLAEDVSDLRESSREELAAWFATNTRRFTVTGRASFRHLYFSFDKRGERAREAAEGVLATLAGRPGASPGMATVADPFMFQDYYNERSPEQVANVFGAKFARSVLQLKPGSWQGPIESGFGWHLVWVDSMTPARVPAFEEVEPEVKAEWVAEQRASFKRQAFEAMRARYAGILPGAAAKATAANGTLQGKEAP